VSRGRYLQNKALPSRTCILRHSTSIVAVCSQLRWTTVDDQYDKLATRVGRKLDNFCDARRWTEDPV